MDRFISLVKLQLKQNFFSEIVRKLPDNDITIETDDQYKATITCEKACFQIMGQEGEEFPSLPEIEKIKVSLYPSFL